MPSQLTYDKLRAERRAAQVRAVEPSELRRMHARWSEGMSARAIGKLHGFGEDYVKTLCAGVPRPVREKLKRQAPSGLGGPE